MNPLYQFDQEMFRAIHVGLRRDWLDPIMVVFTDSGRGEVFITALVAICLFARYRQHALMALVAGASSGLVAQALKGVIARERPSNFSYAEPITTYIEALYGQHAPLSDNSFPSGHSTSAFAIAVAVAWATRKTEHAWVGWAAMGWAVLVGFSRVYVGVHFVSDVLAGAALGTVFGTLCYWIWRRRGWLKDLHGG